MVRTGLAKRRKELEREVLEVLETHHDGYLTLTQETQSIDFKEEANRRAPGGHIHAGERTNPLAATKLANEVACMANSPGGGALIYGVEDKTGKIIGTELDIDWLRERIFRSIDVAPDIQEQLIDGQRILVLFVAESHEPIEDEGGNIRWRVGDKCVPVDRTEWWQFRESMHNYDFMAQPSSFGPEDVRPAAMRIAQEWLGHDELSRTDGEFLRYIGALRSDGKLSEAAALLLCSMEHVAVELTEFDVPGGSVLNRVTVRPGESLAEQISRIEGALDVMNTKVTVKSGLSDQQVRRVPRDAVREAILNGIIHRDWNLSEPTEVRWIDADSTLEVVSPGGFVGEVNSSNILSQRSARYPALADLFRAVGLVDKQGVGVDRMYRSQIALGHRPPEIIEIPGPYVRTTLVGGTPSTPVVKLMDSIRPVERKKDFRLAILVYQLLHHPFVTERMLAEALQASDESARNTLQVAVQTIVGGEPVVRKYQDVWLLGDGARQIVESSQTPDAVFKVLEYRSTDEFQVNQTVALWLESHLSISTGELRILSGVSQTTAKKMLDGLVDSGMLKAVGKGRASRYEAH